LGYFHFSLAKKENIGTTLFAESELDKLLRKRESAEVLFKDIQQEQERASNKLYYKAELVCHNDYTANS
jgi:hypothetical protein